MRPVPSSRHVLSVVLFLAIAAGSGYLAWGSDRLSGEQFGFAAAAAKRHDPDIMPYDSVYGQVNADGRMRQLHTPVFLALMDMVLIPAGHKDLTLPFRVMAGPMVLLFLCGMYALIWRQTRSSSIAAYVAVLAMTVTHTFGNWFWGVGSLGSIGPAGLVTAVAPLILLSYLQNADRARLVLTFAAIGLCANLHLVASVNLALVLLIVHLGRNRFSFRSIIRGVGCVVFFLLGALPYLLYFLTLRHSIAAHAPGGAGCSAEVVIGALRISNLEVLYPEMLKPLLQWGLYSAVLVALAGLMLWYIGRFRTREIDVWIWIAAVGLFVALGVHGVSQLAGWAWGSAPPVIDFVQASCWVMPALYVLFALALMQLFRIVQRHRQYLRYACAAFMIAWMLPSDNLRPVRHAIYRTATVFLDEADKPIRLQELAERVARKAELAAVAQWADTNTDNGAVFITDQVSFRMQAGRSVFVNRQDVRYFYYLAPWLLEDWTAQVMRQYRWMGIPLDAATMGKDIGRLSATKAYQGVTGWYLILPARVGLAQAGPLEEIPSETWGQYWRVFRILPSTRTAQPGR